MVTQHCSGVGERGGEGSAHVLDATGEGLAVAGVAAGVAEEEEHPTVIQEEEVLLGSHQIVVAVRGGRQDGGHQRSLPAAAQALQVQPLGVWRAGSRDIVTGWGTKCHHPLLPWQWRGLTVEDGNLLAGPGAGSGGGERGAEVAPGGLAVAHRLEVMAGSPTASITPHPSSSTPTPSSGLTVTSSSPPVGCQR